MQFVLRIAEVEYQLLSEKTDIHMNLAELIKAREKIW